MTPTEWNNCLTNLCEVLEDWEATEKEVAELTQNLLSEFKAREENRNEAASEVAQERLRESGGPDDSKYRRDMIDAGRGHLLRDCRHVHHH